jgi:inositol-phosphate transport system ATP-binding protein
MARVELKEVRKQWLGATAVERIDLAIDDGAFVAVLGPSGCGKTTTLMMLAGIYNPTAGDIAFDGERVNDVEARDRNVGIVFQSYALYPNMSVLENILFPLRFARVERVEAARRAREMAALVRIEALLDRRPSQLSGGQQQRVALARALVKRPHLLLLDEPLSNLDASLRLTMRTEIRRIQRELGVTTILVTHDQIEATTMADRVVVMNAGRVEQVAPPRELYDHPANPFVMSFVGPVNRIGESWVRPHDIEITHEPNGPAHEAQVDRIVRLGFEVRVDIVRDDGERLHVQLTRNEAEVLELAPGDIVYVRTRVERTFSESGEPTRPVPA